MLSDGISVKTKKMNVSLLPEKFAIGCTGFHYVKLSKLEASILKKSKCDSDEIYLTHFSFWEGEEKRKAMIDGGRVRTMSIHRMFQLYQVHYCHIFSTKEQQRKLYHVLCSRNYVLHTMMNLCAIPVPIKSNPVGIVAKS